MDLLTFLLDKAGLSFTTLVIIILLLLIGRLLYKIATNHLSHVQGSLDRIEKSQEDLHTKINGVCERVSKLEGIVEK